MHSDEDDLRSLRAEDLIGVLREKCRELPILDWCVFVKVYEETYSADIVLSNKQRFFNVPIGSLGADPSSGAGAFFMPTEGSFGIVGLIPSMAEHTFQPVVLCSLMPVRGGDDELALTETHDEGAMISSNVLLGKQGDLFRQLREKISKGSFVVRTPSGSKIVLHSSGDVQILASDMLQVLMSVRRDTMTQIAKNLRSYFYGGFLELLGEDNKVDLELVLSDVFKWDEGNRLVLKVGHEAALIDACVVDSGATTNLTLKITSGGEVSLTVAGKVNINAGGDVTIDAKGNFINLNPAS